MPKELSQSATHQSPSIETEYRPYRITLDDLRSIWQQDRLLQPILLEVDAKRKQALNKLRIKRIIILISFIGVPLLSLVHIAAGCGYLWMWVGIFLIWWGYNADKNDFDTEYKERIIGYFLKRIDENLHYSRTQMTGWSELAVDYRRIKNERDFPPRGGNKIWGKIGDVRLEFSDLHLSTLDKDDGTTPYFRGTYLVAEFNKNFKTTTILLPKGGFLSENDEDVLDWHFILKMKMEKLTLEDPEFNKQFNVFCEDQIDSRYVLSLSLMRRVVEFRNQTKKDMTILFSPPSSLHIAIEKKRWFGGIFSLQGLHDAMGEDPIGGKSNQSYVHDSFRAPLKRSILDFDTIEEPLSLILFAISIVNELNLNTRIWAKTNSQSHSPSQFSNIWEEIGTK